MSSGQFRRTMGAVALVLGAWAGGQQAVAAPIVDGYVGGTVSGWGDVIGAASMFDVRSLTATRTGTRLHVVIDTAFAGNAGVFAGLTSTAAGGGRGIGYGDLFLAGEWAPFGSAPYTEDRHDTGTHWTYAFSLDDRWNNAGGSGRLYALDGASNDANVLLSNDFLSGGIYRRGQVVAVDRAAASVHAGTAGTWAVDPLQHLLTFDVDLAGTALAHDHEIALHWGMGCGNDVIEGRAEVPAPAMPLVFVLGIAAFARPRRRRG